MNDLDTLLLENQRLERELRAAKMVLLDEFAMRAMQAWLSTYADSAQHPSYSERGCERIARQSYDVAEAMLTEHIRRMK